MRIGLMIGPERGDAARKVDRMVREAEWAEQAGLDSVWIPQIPTDFDALTAVTALGLRTSTIELGTAVVPMQAQHPVALARQALSADAAIGGRLSLGVGPSHHWIVRDMLGLPYDKPAAYARDYLEVLNAALSGTDFVEVVNSTFSVHNPFDLSPVAPVPVMVVALGPVMLRQAGLHTAGTVLWLADERVIAEHIAPRITGAASGAGRPAPRIMAGLRCACAARRRSTTPELAPTASWTRPNSQRLLELGDARNVGDMCIAGDEDTIAAGLSRYIAAGATDLSIRLLPLGDDRESLVASKRRARRAIADVATALRG